MGNRNAQIVVLVVLLLLLLTAVGVLVTGYMNIGEELQVAEKEAQGLQKELDELDDYIMEIGMLFKDKKVEVSEKSTELKDLYDKINALEVQIAQLRNEGQVKDKTIIELQNRLNKAKATVYDQTKSDVPDLLNLLVQYQHQIDTMLVQGSTASPGTPLSSDDADRAKQLREANERIAELTDMLTMVKRLSATKFNFYNIKNGSTSNRDLRFPQVAMDQLKVCFTIPNNPLSARGPRTVYMILRDPDSKTATNFAQKLSGTEDINGSSTLYSVQKQIDYQHQEDLSVCINFKPDDAWKVGTQSIQIYCDNEIIGKTEFDIIN